MKIATLLSTGTLGLAGLVAAGLIALPGQASTSAAGDEAAKRDEDLAEVVLVADDDDDDTNDNTRSRSRSRSREASGTGRATGRDDSRERKVVDRTADGPGFGNRDRSARQSNDRSRNNTRR